jgi:hypothetical protein
LPRFKNVNQLIIHYICCQIIQLIYLKSLFLNSTNVLIWKGVLLNYINILVWNYVILLINISLILIEINLENNLLLFLFFSTNSLFKFIIDETQILKKLIEVIIYKFQGFVVSWRYIFTPQNLPVIPINLINFKVLICNGVKDYGESRVCEAELFWWNKSCSLERQNDDHVDCFIFFYILDQNLLEIFASTIENNDKLNANHEKSTRWRWDVVLVPHPQ